MATQKGKNVSGTVDGLIREEVEKQGYILWDVEYKKEGVDYNLIVTIDLDEREVTMDDCVKVTDAINPILDEADPIQDSYCLEVSSAGLERELRLTRHFEKYIGKEAEFKLFASTEDLKKSFVATIVGCDDGSVTFSVDGVEHTLERAKVASVKTIVDYANIFKNN